MRPLLAFIGSGDVVVGGDGVGSISDGDCLLLVGGLKNFEAQHDSRCNIGEILDLATIVGLALKGEVHWTACVDKTPLTPNI